MAEIIIYTKDYCPYCVRAKQLLKQKGQSFKEIDISRDEKLQQEMIEKSGGRRTVPQIFINGSSIGGFQELQALDSNGRLSFLLAG